MRYFLENDKLKVEIDSHGAEVKSVLNRQGMREYMWYGNAKYWGRTSPVLFPFVGSVRDKKYRVDGQEYNMGQHGFARDFEHTLVEQTEDYIEFEFKSSEETLQRYPYEFILNISYRLAGNELTVGWKVTNPATKDMYFQIGAHPAFLCPIHGEGSKDGYKLYFEGVDQIHHHGNDVPTGMAKPYEDIVLPLMDNRVTISDEFFDRCTYFIPNHQTGCVGLEDPSGSRIVTLKFDTPIFAIWSPEGKKAPFVCIEPWFGRCDAEGFAGDISERDYENRLGSDGVFENEYSIIFS